MPRSVFVNKIYLRIARHCCSDSSTFSGLYFIRLYLAIGLLPSRCSVSQHSPHCMLSSLRMLAEIFLRTLRVRSLRCEAREVEFMNRDMMRSHSSSQPQTKNLPSRWAASFPRAALRARFGASPGCGAKRV